MGKLGFDRFELSPAAYDGLAASSPPPPANHWDTLTVQRDGQCVPVVRSYYRFQMDTNPRVILRVTMAQWLENQTYLMWRRCFLSCL